MYSFLNINDIIRTNLQKVYEQFLKMYDNEQAILEINNFINNIKEQNYLFYQTLIGLGFIDRFSILNEKQKYDNLTEYEEQILELFNDICDLNDLEQILDSNPDILNYIINGIIIFNRLNKKNKAKALLQLDDKLIYNFNQFHLVEKCEMFKDVSIYEIIEMYKKTKEFYIEETIIEIIELFDIQLLANSENYNQLLLQMVQELYKWYKAMDTINSEIIFDLDKKMIELVENYNVDEIVFNLTNDCNLLENLIRNFLYYETNELEIDKNEVNLIYEEVVDAKVKAKLKEV